MLIVSRRLREFIQFTHPREHHMAKPCKGGGLRRHKQTSSSLSGVRTVSTPSLFVFLPSSPNEFFLGWGAGGRQISQNCGEGTHHACAALPTSARWLSRILHQKLHLKSSSHKRQSLNMNFLGEILFDHPAHSPAHSHSMRHSPTSRRIMVKVKSRNLCRRVALLPETSDFRRFAATEIPPT